MSDQSPEPPPARDLGVALRLLASLVALAAGVSALVVAILLVRSTLGG